MFENAFIISTTGALNSGMMTSTTWMYDKVSMGHRDVWTIVYHYMSSNNITIYIHVRFFYCVQLCNAELPLQWNQLNVAKIQHLCVDDISMQKYLWQEQLLKLIHPKARQFWGLRQVFLDAHAILIDTMPLVIMMVK